MITTRTRFMLLITLLVLSVTGKAQQDIVASYEKQNIEIVDGEVISNVLKLVNTTASPMVAKVLTDYPQEWRQLGAQMQEVIVPAKDSVFVPLRIIPMEIVGGNNKFMINANVMNANEKFISGATFWAFTKKHTSWVVNSLTGNKIYFRNGESEVDFKVNVLNTGGENQRITMTMNNMSMFTTVVDSLGANKTLKPIQLSLGVFQDTTLKLTFKHQNAERNTNRIDIENHKPHTNNEEKTFSLFVNTEEPNLGEQGAFSANQRIIFKKLSDKTQSNPNAFSTIPVVVDYNVSNLMDNISFSVLNVRGNAQLSGNSQIMYNLQTNASSDNYASALQNTNYYFGYFNAKANVQLGFVNGGIMGLQSFGKGVKAGYQVTKRANIGGYYVVNDNRLGQQYLASKGAVLQFNYYKQNKLVAEYGETNNDAIGVNTKVFNVRTGLNFLRSQNIGVSISNSWNTAIATNTSKSGIFYLVNYSGNFFKNKLNLTHGIGNNSSGYSSAGVSRFLYNHRTRYMISEKWNLTLVNNYNKMVSEMYRSANTTSLTNQLSVTRSFKFQSVQLAAIYNQFTFQYATNEIKGIGINHNTYKPKESFRFSTNIEIGVSNPKDTSSYNKSQPYMLFNSIMFYKTLSVNARYIMGNYGATPVINASATGVTQQLFTSALQHQYLFKNTQFMLQTGMNYFYNNVFKQHSMNVFPEMYYFSKTGWRFRAGVNYNVISSLSLRNVYNSQFSSEDAPRVTNQGFFISFGVRKEFTVANPVRKQKFVNANFEVFFDVNGNGIKDRNERAFENVVLRVNDDEVITNADGAATILDANAGLAKIAVMPLDETQGWFANIPDSIILMKDRTVNIPFVKGVKIKGRVTIKREQVAANATEPFDLSLIKISAVGNKTFNSLTSSDGTFEFYLPFGKYTLIFDEKVLGDKFKVIRNNIEVEANKEADGLVVSFNIVERVRKINKKVFTTPATTTPQNQH